MYDSWSSESLYPVISEEEADLIIILTDGKETGLPDFRRMIRYGWNYQWIGKEDPRPLDTEKLKEMIREKYVGVDPKLLENLIRKAGKEHMVEKTPLSEPEPKSEPVLKADEGEKDYRYMANRDDDPPTLIRLGSFARMEADLFAYPGVWKDMPHLNDIRLGMGSAMNYDDISEKEAEEIREKLQEYYDRKAAEERR